MEKIFNKNILVYGTGISGIATVRALNKLGNKIFIYDDNKSLNEIKKIDGIKNINYKFFSEIDEDLLNRVDILVKSPSISLDNPVIEKAKSLNIPVYSDIELAYRISDKDLIVITGTNGKTTTTSLIHKILNDFSIKAGITGNIGSGILEDVLNKKYEILVVEASSYQLSSIELFKPKISVITNITPDHLNWHGNLDNYINAKLNIFKNQDSEDYAILNYDDDNIRKNLAKIKANIIFFSTKNKLDRGIFTENNKIFIKLNNNEEVIEIDEIKIPGNHNIENVMASIGVAKVLDIPITQFKKTITNFTGVEHRLEYINSSVKSVSFYNDSKGTNPESTKKAIDALKNNIIIILGGYNKNSSFDDLADYFPESVKHAVILGETKYNIKKSLDKIQFSDYTIVDNLEEAVNKAFEISKKNDKILLSPACASWDMYGSFEERGRHFKEIIKKLEKEVNNEKKQ